MDEHWAFAPRISLPLDENKLANITSFGVQQPIKVEVVRGEDGTKQYIVVDGRQRIRYAREANKRLAKQGEPLLTVPVTASKDSGEDTLVALNVGLNEARTDDGLLEKAEKAARMKLRCQSVQAIAVAF